MKKDVRKFLLGGVFVVGSLGTVMVHAQTGGAQSGSQVQSQPSVQGSVPVHRGSASYADMASVSLQDAVSAAQQFVGASATPISAELEVENGFLVWSVTLGNREVYVDAGDGSVLQTRQAEREPGEYESEGSRSEGEYQDGDSGSENEDGEYENESDEGADD